MERQDSTIVTFMSLDRFGFAKMREKVCFYIICRLLVEVMAHAIVVNVIVKLVTEELIVKTAQ